MLPLPLAESSVTLPWSSPLLWGGILIVCLPASVATIKGLLEIIGWFLHKPALSEVYAKKEELEEAEERFTDALAANRRDRVEMENRITGKLDHQDRYQEGNQKELQSIHAQLGKIFGLLEGGRPTRRANGS